MAIVEKDIAITYKQGNDTIIAYPVTKVDNVEGAVSETDLGVTIPTLENGKIPASQLPELSSVTIKRW